MSGAIMDADASKGYGSIIGGALVLVLAPVVALVALIGWACGKLREKARGAA